MTDSLFERQMLLMKQGDKQGLKEIYDEYGRLIYSVMVNVVKNNHNAEDLTSDFFLKIWSMTDNFLGGNGHKRWLVTIARNMAIDFLRKNGREELTIDVDSNDSDDAGFSKKELADNVDSESTVIGNMTVNDALQKLEGLEREVINLKLFAELTFKEIAKILGKPLGTVTWKYRNAILKLQKYVKEVQD